MRIIVALLVVLAGCGADASGTSLSTTTSTSPEPTTAAAPSYPESDLSDATLGDIVDDAAERTDSDPTSVSVTSIENREFNDSSLGCPEEGVMYTQVITSGYVVLVDAGGEALDYRVEGQSEDFRLCE